MIKRWSISLIFLSLFSVLSFAQESNLGNWFIGFGSKNIQPALNLHYEAQYRNYNAIGDLEQLLLRTGIGYNLTENNNNLLLGYGFIRSENYGDSSTEKAVVNEHRIFQQFITRQQVARVSLQHRYRFEQRFVEGEDQLRFRYFLGVNIPLNHTIMKDGTTYFSMYNEVFIGTQGSYFDRNRLYGGIGYKLNKSIRMEVGYMNQFFQNGGRDQVNLILFINT